MEIERRGQFQEEKSLPQGILRRKIEVQAPRVIFMNACLTMKRIERLRCGEQSEMPRLLCVRRCR